MSPTKGSWNGKRRYKQTSTHIKVSKMQGTVSSNLFRWAPFLSAALSLSVDSSTARWHWWVKLWAKILLKYCQDIIKNMIEILSTFDQDIIKIKMFSTAGNLEERCGRFWDTSKGWLLSLCAGQPEWYYLCRSSSSNIYFEKTSKEFTKYDQAWCRSTVLILLMCKK